MKTILPLVLLAICYVFFFEYVFASYSNLPPRLATHFDIEGHPNGWMSRDALVDFILGLSIFLPATIIAIMALTNKIPARFVNLPNRDYWLAPERRRETAGVLLRFGLWFACLNVLFITGVHWLIIQSNAPGHMQYLQGMHIALVAGGFLVGTLVWIGFLTNRLRLKN